MTIRESWVMQWFAVAMAFIFGGFALTTMWIGDKVTSKQWQYLMSIPGHKWSWGIVFLLCAVLIINGVYTDRYKRMAIGFFLAATASLLIGGFYVCAPFLGEQLLTLGMWPWFVVSVVCWGAAYFSWKPLTWE